MSLESFKGIAQLVKTLMEKAYLEAYTNKAFLNCDITKYILIYKFVRASFTVWFQPEHPRTTFSLSQNAQYGIDVASAEIL